MILFSDFPSVLSKKKGIFGFSILNTTKHNAFIIFHNQSLCPLNLEIFKSDFACLYHRNRSFYAPTDIAISISISKTINNAAMWFFFLLKNAEKMLIMAWRSSTLECGTVLCCFLAVVVDESGTDDSTPSWTLPLALACRKLYLYTFSELRCSLSPRNEGFCGFILGKPVFGPLFCRF